MQRVCTKCNTLVTGDGAFCPSCGEPLPAAVQLEKTPQTTPMGASQQNDVMPSANSIPNYSQQNSYTAPQPAQINNYGSSNAQQFNNNVQPVNDPPMTLGQSGRHDYPYHMVRYHQPYPLYRMGRKLGYSY